MMTLREAARFLGTSYGVAYAAARRGELRARQDPFTWGWQVREADVADLRARWQVRDALAALTDALRVAEAGRTRPERERERAEREALRQATRDRAEAAREQAAADARLAREAERRRAAGARLASAVDAGEYALAAILAAEDGHGRNVFWHLTRKPGNDPAARVTRAEVADLPTFIRGLDP